MWLQGGSQAYVGKGWLRLTTREVDLLSVCVTIDTPHWCTVRNHIAISMCVGTIAIQFAV